MAKHTQTIRRQVANELFECVWHFVGLVIKGLKITKVYSTWSFEQLAINEPKTIIKILIEWSILLIVS